MGPNPVVIRSTQWVPGSNGTRRRVHYDTPIRVPTQEAQPACEVRIQPSPLPMPPSEPMHVDAPSPPLTQNASPQPADTAPSEVRIKKYTSPAYLLDWIERRRQLDMAQLLSLETKSSDTCQQCLSKFEGLYRCLHCFGDGLLCRSCCVNIHARNPFHHIEEWTDRGFRATSLDNLGLVLYLGHYGKPCSKASRSTVSSSKLHIQSRMTIVHTSGAHNLRVQWCMCSDKVDKYTQLFQARLFPATIDEPATAFTFELLEDMKLHHNECATSSLNYYSLITRRTSFDFSHQVENRVGEMDRISRCYSDLEARKRAGEFDCSADVARGKLGLFCPACPQVGKNLTPRTVTQDDPAWVTAPLLVADGNFKLDHLAMKCPHNNVTLRDGSGYVVGRDTYNAHLESSAENREKSTCSNHKAVNQANRQGPAHLDATGVGAIACARHGCFVPHTVVDFKKGEQQKNMDFAVSETLSYFTSREGSPQSILFIYDIMCQYGVHLEERLSKGTYLTLPNIEIRKAVGKFHLGAHVESCFSKFALDYMLGAGRTNGEVLETLWSMTNHIAGATRSMTSSHRQEVLDDFMFDCNWKKLTKLADTLVRRLQKAEKGFSRSEKTYRDFRTCIDGHYLPEWDDSVNQAERLRGAKLTIFEMAVLPSPSVAEVRHQLDKEERLRPRELRRGIGGMLALGLRIEEFQISLRHGLAAGYLSARQIQKRRQHLKSQLKKFRDKRACLLSRRLEDTDQGNDADDDDEDDEDDEDDDLEGDKEVDNEVNDMQLDPEDTDVVDLMNAAGDHPELEMVALPSSMPLEESVFDGLAEQEIKLRVAQIHDCLRRLRAILGEKSLRFRTTLKGHHGQKQSTRAWKQIKAHDNQALVQVDIYEAALVALSALDPKQAATWPKIDRNVDLKMKGGSLEQHRSSSSSHVLPWFWQLANTGDVSVLNEDSPDMIEFYRVHYVRYKAAQNRWSEECILLRKEMQWSIEWFQSEASRWENILKSNRNDPGKVAFAMRMSDRWWDFKERSVRVYRKAGYM